jgi:hypothetical protein
MTFLHNIRTVARYEATTLRRSWFFRLFSIGALLIFTFLNIGFFSPIGDESWALVSIPSSIPLFNLYLLNIAQSIVVIFLAADFLKRDKKVDTNEVLYTRSMSNFEYVMGKTIGILRLFLGLDIIILAIGMLMNIISKSMTIDLMSYLSYLLIICVPTILFSLGLAFVLMSIIRNQAITFLILLGIAALNMFWLWHRFGSIFDYMAFGLPVFKSTIVGFDNINLILNQRLLYFFLGLFLVLTTVLLFKRLPQNKAHTTISLAFMIIFFAGAVVCGFNTYSFYRNTINEKKQVIETGRQFEGRDFVRLTDADIDISHNGELVDASAGLKFTNQNSQNLSAYLFSLNPGLKVTGVTSGGKELTFKQTYNIIEIDPGKSLAPGECDSIVISYGGTIIEAFCYPNYTDNIKETPFRAMMLNVNKRQAFLTEKYVLLTPETYWYPVPGLNYYPSNPARIKVDFTNYTLRVRPGTGMAAVSQGTMKDENGTYVFKPESPLTGLTLAIGDYKSDTLKVDSIKYIAWYLNGHDFFKKELSLISDTLPLLVSGIMRELETNFSTKYPFRSLTLLEVPVQFYSYPKMNTQTRAELQPSMVLIPEKLSSLLNRSFNKQFTRQKKNMARQNQVITDKELQVRIFNTFIRNTFISGQNFRFVNGAALNEPTRYRLGPSFYFFKNNFYSSEYPVINAVFESHLQKVSTPQAGFMGMGGGLSDNDKANLILKNGSFREILALNPASDTIRAVLTVKGDYLFNLIRSKTGIDEFKEWFQKYIEDHEFQCVDIRKFNYDLKMRFGFEFYPYLENWFNMKDQPGFNFGEPQVNEILVGDRVRYLVTFIASNPESVPGIFNVAFRTGGPGSGRGGGQMAINMVQGGPIGGGGNFSISVQGRGMEAADISKIIELEPRQAKRIGIILDGQPRAMMINTLFSKNIPGERNIPVGEPRKLKAKSSDFREEETSVPLPAKKIAGEIIVDNEDPGFDAGNTVIQAPLKRLLGIKSRRDEGYQQINMFWAPDYWQSVVQSAYYGDYILSSVYTRAGTGDKSVKWATRIDDPGYYDIYCFIGKQGGGSIRVSGGPRGGGGQAGQGGPGGPMGGQQGDNPYKDMHYKIYHDEGVEEITVDFENAEGGWNMLGRYYLSPDSAKVELTNQSAGRIVLGDAIKWVKVN